AADTWQNAAQRIYGGPVSNRIRTCAAKYFFDLSVVPANAGILSAGFAILRSGASPRRRCAWVPAFARTTRKEPLCVLELQLGEARIEAAGADQALVVALLDDAAFIHHQDAI